MALHGDGVEELSVHLHPGLAGKILGQHLAEQFPRLGCPVGIGRPDRQAVDAGAEP